MPSKPLRSKTKLKSGSKWDHLPWKQIDCSTINVIGNDNTEAMFYELEEIDSSELVFDVKGVDSKKRTASALDSNDEIETINSEKIHNDDSQAIDPNESLQSSQISVKAQTKKAKKNKSIQDSLISMKQTSNVVTVSNQQKTWGNQIELNSLLCNALDQLGFISPTPIQTQAIPYALTGQLDILGAAETGSGKTLAFLIPIINWLLNHLSTVSQIPMGQCHHPYAMIIAPTRELSIQIGKVAMDLSMHCTPSDPISSLQSVGRQSVGRQSAPVPPLIRVVNVVGGLSEHKQRRLLSGQTPCHILISTTGRLCQLLADEEAVSLQDMSHLQFIVVDEADRIMEDGHFPELHQVLSRVNDHESIRLRGEDPMIVAKQRKEPIWDEILEGAGPVDDEDHMIEEPSPLPLPHASMASGPIRSDRLLFLYSATVIHAVRGDNNSSQQMMKKNKKIKLNGTLKGITDKCTISNPLKELLAMAGRQKTIMVMDVTRTKPSVVPVEEGQATSTPRHASVLPEGLSQYEVRVPNEDKDTFAYYYLLQNPERSLLFVNSIKTARRVDGLLRALGIHSRTIHSQMQQKQRLSALEAFQSSPVGVLVATDVAARGLDIPMIQSVIHYDVARSPQVYIHRSGRTARANHVGLTLSLVSPEDVQHHNEILRHLDIARNAFPPFTNIDLAWLPLLRQRVKLAKKIFTQSFVSNQVSKEIQWVEQCAKEADLALDDHIIDEIGSKEVQNGTVQASKKDLAQLKSVLKKLLDCTVEDYNKNKSDFDEMMTSGKKLSSSITQNFANSTVKNKINRSGRRNNSKLNVIKSGIMTSKQNRGGLFVYAK